MAEFGIADLTSSPEPSRRTGEVQDLALQDQLRIRGTQLSRRSDELGQLATDLALRERALDEREQELAAREKVISEQAVQLAQTMDAVVRRDEAAQLREARLYTAEQDLDRHRGSLLEAVHEAGRLVREERAQDALRSSGARAAGWSPELTFAVRCRIAVTAHPQVIAREMQRQLRSLDLVHPDVKVSQAPLRG